MDNFTKEIVQGRKTFFISPDRSMFPESYLEEYLLHGFECYFIDNDIILPLEKKLDIILSVFKDSIVFFNIDGPVQNNDWPSFIAKAQAKYSEALFGVLFAKRKTLAEKQNIERLYLLDLGLKCGAIQLEYQKTNNYELLEKTLFANQAMGRRKNVRTILRGTCTIQFLDNENKPFNAKLNDISLTHFSFTVDSKNPFSLKDYEKISDAHLFIKGLHFRSDALIVMKRPVEKGILYVLAFCKEDGKIGLNTYNRGMLIPKIYSIMNESCMNLLSELFRAAQKELRQNQFAERNV